MPAVTITTPFPIFTDVDGNPLEDGYVYVGTNGLNPETNPIQLYWDQALTVPAAQPIRTIGGYASRSGTPGQLYANAVNFSMLVKDKNGSLVWSSLSGTGISPNADGVTYMPAGAGAVDTTVQAKLRESVSVKDFGAVGDGVTDDTAAIQAADTACGGRLFFPPGNYLHTGLTIGDGHTWEGAGQKDVFLTYDGTGNTITIGGTEGSPYNCQCLSDMSIVGPSIAQASQHGIYIENQNGGLLLKRCRIYGHGDAGVYSRGYNFYCVIDQCDIYGNLGDYNIQAMRATTGSQYRTNVLQLVKSNVHGGDGGINAQDCTHVIISEGCGFEASSGVNPEVNINTCTSVDIKDNYFERSSSGTAEIIKIDGADTSNRSIGVNVAGNIISTSSAITHDQVSLGFVDYYVSTGNTFVRSGASVNSLAVGANSRYVLSMDKLASGWYTVASGATGVNILENGVNRSIGVSSASIVESAQIAGDANYRFQKVSTGELRWGNGSSAWDTNIYRVGVNKLQTDDMFVASDSVIIKPVAGVVSDGSFTAAVASGLIAVDTTNSRLYVRVGSTWKYATLT